MIFYYRLTLLVDIVNSPDCINYFNITSLKDFIKWSSLSNNFFFYYFDQSFILAKIIVKCSTPIFQ